MYQPSELELRYLAYLEEHGQPRSPQEASYFANYLAQRGELGDKSERQVIIDLEGKVPDDFVD